MTAPPPLRYATNETITVDQFVDVLRRSTLAERRPVDDRDRVAAMLRHANLVCTAWHGDLLVGVSRSLTDFAYCCYLSDLAVDQAWQRQGIGAALIRLTQQCLHPEAKVILLAAPKARAYYPRIGMQQHDSAWLVPAGSLVASAPLTGGAQVRERNPPTQARGPAPDLKEPLRADSARTDVLTPPRPAFTRRETPEA